MLKKIVTNLLKKCHKFVKKNVTNFFKKIVTNLLKKLSQICQIFVTDFVTDVLQICHRFLTNLSQISYKLVKLLLKFVRPFFQKKVINKIDKKSPQLP